MSETVQQAFAKLAAEHKAAPKYDLCGDYVDTVTFGYGHVKLLTPHKAEFKSGDITTCVTTTSNFRLAMEMFSPRIQALYDEAVKRGLNFELKAGHKRYHYEVCMSRVASNGKKVYGTYTDINQFNGRMLELIVRVAKDSVEVEGGDLGYIQNIRDLFFLGVPYHEARIDHPAAKFFPTVYAYKLQDLKDATPKLT